MKMNVFEFTVSAKGEDIAAFENLKYAIEFAKSYAEKQFCDVDVVNAFTGEVHKSYVTYAHLIYNSQQECLKTMYDVKEREW